MLTFSDLYHQGTVVSRVWSNLLSIRCQVQIVFQICDRFLHQPLQNVCPNLRPHGLGEENEPGTCVSTPHNLKTTRKQQSYYCLVIVTWKIT